MLATRRPAACAALSVATLLSACGGGGGDDLPTLQVTFAQPTLALSIQAAQTGRAAQVAVTVSPAPAHAAVLRVSQAPAFFDLAGLTITDDGGGHFLVDLPIPDGVATGSHAGALDFQICEDLACARAYPLSRSSLAYRVDVLPQAVVPGTVAYTTAGISGVAWDDETARDGFFTFTITPAPAVAPVMVVLDGAGFFTPGPVPVFEFQGTYYAYPPYPDSQPAGDHTGTVTFQLCEDDTCAAGFALPQPTVPFDVTIHHVQAGLPPLTAAFRLDDAAVTSVNEGLDAAGDRTYALEVKVGQVLEVQLSANPLLISRSAPGDTAILARLSSTYPVLRYQASLPTGASSGVGSLKFRVEDGRWASVTLHVTP